MQLHLAVQAMRAQADVTVVHRGGGLIAGGLNAKHTHGLQFSF
jgi:hypothetical protein